MHLRTLVLIAFAMSAAGCGAPNDAPTPDDLINQARQLDLDGQQDAAIALYRQALERAPDSFDAHYGIARALDLAGGHDEAREHFAIAIRLAPDSSRDQTLRMMGPAWTFVANADQAAQYFREVFDRRTADGNPAGAADVANELGRVYLELGNLAGAEEWYRTGYETSADEGERPAWQVDLADIRWAHAQARIAARRGQAEEARRQEAMVEALLDKGGNEDQQIQYPYLRGYVAFHLGDHAAAVAALEEADQNDPFILLLLAEASEQLGDQTAASAYYRKLLESSSHAVNNAFAWPAARLKVASEG